MNRNLLNQLIIDMIVKRSCEYHDKNMMLSSRKIAFFILTYTSMVAPTGRLALLNILIFFVLPVLNDTIIVIFKWKFHVWR